ncbi:PQQ-binding-like beta-propeller repeat protein [Nocardiopsis rhodophaea]
MSSPTLETSRKQHLAAWIGLEAPLAGVVLLAVADMMGTPGTHDGDPVWWALWASLALWGVAWTTDLGLSAGRSPATTAVASRHTGPVRALVTATASLAAILTYRDFPADYFGARLGQAATAADLAAVLQNLGTAAIAAGALVAVYAGRPAAVRPFRLTVPAAVSSTLALVLLAGLAATDTARTGVDHTTADPFTAPSIPETVRAVSWVWVHPEEGSDEDTDVIPTSTGVVVADDSGVFSLDTSVGEERWRFRLPNPVARVAVTPDGTLVLVAFPSPQLDGSLLERFVVMDSATGEIVADYVDESSDLSSGAVEDVASLPNLHLTGSTLVTVPPRGSEGSVKGRDLLTGKDLWTWLPDSDCTLVVPRTPLSAWTGLVATENRILLVENCRRPSGGEFDRLVGLDAETGDDAWTRESPPDLRSLDVAPDGALAIARYAVGKDSDGLEAVAFSPFDGSVIEKGLPGGRASVLDKPEPDLNEVRAGDERSLLWAGAKNERSVISYRQEFPGSGRSREALIDPGSGWDSWFYNAEKVEVGQVVALPEAAVGVISGAPAQNYGRREEDPLAVVSSWDGEEDTTIDLEEESSAYANDGANEIGMYVAPGAVVLSGFMVGRGDRAHVVGLGKSPMER